MRIMPTRQIAEKIMRLLEIKPYSSMVNSIITNSIGENSIIPDGVEELRTKAIKINQYMRARGNTVYTDDKIMLLLLVSSLIVPHYYVHKLLKKIEITTPDQIDYYLTPKNIINLINKTKIKF